MGQEESNDNISQAEVATMRHSFRNQNFSDPFMDELWNKAFNQYKKEKSLHHSALKFKTRGVYAVVLSYFESKLEEE